MEDKYFISGSHLYREMGENAALWRWSAITLLVSSLYTHTHTRTYVQSLHRGFQHNAEKQTCQQPPGRVINPLATPHSFFFKMRDCSASPLESGECAAGRPRRGQQQMIRAPLACSAQRGDLSCVCADMRALWRLSPRHVVRRTAENTHKMQPLQLWDWRKVLLKDTKKKEETKLMGFLSVRTNRGGGFKAMVGQRDKCQLSAVPYGAFNWRDH